MYEEFIKDLYSLLEKHEVVLKGKVEIFPKTKYEHQEYLSNNITSLPYVVSSKNFNDVGGPFIKFEINYDLPEELQEKPFDFTGSKAPAIGYENWRKKLPQDFKNVVNRIKKENPYNNMEGF